MTETAGNFAPEFIVPIVLLTIFASAFLSKKTRVPHNIMLVIIGIALSVVIHFSNLLQIGTGLQLDSQLVLEFIIPPLIFEAMMNVDYAQFKRIRISALVLATVGVVVAMVVAGSLLMYVGGLPFDLAFAFSALIAPTDAVIVIEVFKKVKVPKALSNLIESEASFNDATGVIIFSSILAVTAGSGAAIISSPLLGQFTDVSLIGELEHFAFVFLGGVGVGLGISEGARRLHLLVDDSFTEVTLTITTVFGAVALSHIIGVSGLVAAAVAGLYFGNTTAKKEQTMSKATKETVFTFWEIIAFLASSIAFLYLSTSMDLFAMYAHLPLIILAFTAVIASRGFVTFSILSITDKLTKERIPLKWKNVVFIGGMKGAISVALVASLPESEFKQTLQSITFGVVLISIILQYPILSRYIGKYFGKENGNERNKDI